jgi:protein-S-isoprenylcysteine O-methyltransferase Ste14
LAYAGLFIAWGKVIPLIVFFLLYPSYQFLRARKEAEALEKAFGNEYRRYKASTWL